MVHKNTNKTATHVFLSTRNIKTTPLTLFSSVYHMAADGGKPFSEHITLFGGFDLHSKGKIDILYPKAIPPNNEQRKDEFYVNPM